MTVTSANNRTTYVGSGNTGPFEIGFDVSSDSSFSVTRVIIATGVETTLTLNAGSNGYTVDTALQEVTLTESIDSTKRLVFLLNEPITQNDSYLANNTFPSKTVENELDKLTRIALQQQEQIDRAVSLPLGSSLTGLTVPNPSNGKALIWSSSQLINSSSTFDSIITDAAASAAAAATSASTASSAASSAGTSSTSASSSASSASTSATSATNSASSASTSATDAASSASSAATSETNAASSASAASTSASAASTSASGASTSATSAGTSATNAATSATSAATSATTATTQATNASTSATNAATSATSASTSATTATTQATTATNAATAITDKWTFASSTTMADPGTGLFRLNNATISSATAIALSALTAASGNPNLRTYIASWDDSTNTNRGTIIIRKSGSPATFAAFTVSGALTDNTTWLQLAVTYVTGNGSLSAADDVYVQFVRAGDKGADGLGAGDFSTNTSTSVDSEIVLFSSTGGKTGKRSTGSGLALLTSGVLSVTAPTSAGVMIGNGSSAPTTVAPGTSGNVLTSNGSAWASTAASAGAVTLLNTQTASASSTIDFTSTYVTSTYKLYIIELINVINTTAGTDLFLRLSQSGTFATSGYQFVSNYADTNNSTPNTVTSTSATSIPISNTASAPYNSEPLNAIIYVFDPTNASVHKHVRALCNYAAAGGSHLLTLAESFGAFTTNTTACDGIRIFPSSSTIASGTIKLSGVS